MSSKWRLLNGSWGFLLRTSIGFEGDWPHLLAAKDTSERKPDYKLEVD